MRILALAAALLVFSATALGLHEVDHRYEVTGFVRDAEQRPLEGVPVEVRLNGQFIGGGSTDGEGRYAIKLHLHDSDIGATLAVRAGRHQARVRVQAEHGNTTTERVHHVNFLGGEVSEDDLLGFRVPAWAYLLALPFAIWGAIVLSDAIGRRLKRKDKRRR